MTIFGPPNIERLRAKGDVKGLIKALHHREVATRRAAAEALGDLGDRRAGEALATALKDPHPTIRRAAAEALGHLADSRAVPALCGALGDGDTDVQRSAAEALGLIGDPRAIDPLCAALPLGGRGAGVSVAAVEALGRIGDPRAAAALISALSGPVPVRRAAARSLVRLDRRPPYGADAAHYWIAVEDWDRCVGLGSVALEPLVGALHDADWTTCTRAATALGRLGDSRAVPALAEAYGNAHRAHSGVGHRHEAMPFRRAVLEALGELGGQEAVGLLVTVLDGADHQASEDAEKVLSGMGPEIVGPLAEVLATRHPTWRSKGRIAVILVLAGSSLGDKPLRGILGSLDDVLGHPDVKEWGYDEDWKKRDSTEDHRRDRDDAREIEHRLAALWASGGAVGRLAAVDVDACEHRLLDILGLGVDCWTRGRVAVLLVNRGLPRSDPRLRATLDELDRWSSTPDEEEELDTYWTRTTSYAWQRNAARDLLSELGSATTSSAGSP